MNLMRRAQLWPTTENTSICLSSSPVLPFRKGKLGHNQQNTRSRAAPSRGRGRGVLSTPGNPEAVLTAIKSALLLKCNLNFDFGR